MDEQKPTPSTPPPSNDDGQIPPATEVPPAASSSQPQAAPPTPALRPDTPFFSSEPVEDAPLEQDPGAEEFSWEASEYIHHHKPVLWYIAFFAIGFIVAGLLYLILRDWIAVVVVVVMFAALFVYGVRKPETLRYSITSSGIGVGEKFYPFAGFRSFSLVQDQGVPSITFIPMQRFALPLTLYFAPDDSDHITDTLSQHLPYEEHHPDMIDRLSHYLRF